jgi:hypothetical protein
MINYRFPWWKLLAVWIGFLLLHFSYETLPGLFFQVLAEKNETTFLHMKMLFVSYILITLVEFFIRRKKLTSPGDFIYSRLLLAVAYPWLTITFWFTAESLGFHIPVIPWELIYANITTLLGIYLTLRLEEPFDRLSFRPATRVMILVLFSVAILSYVAFSFQVPQPFFTSPAGG